MTDFLLHFGWLNISMSAVIVLVLMWCRVRGRGVSAKGRYALWMSVILSLCVGIFLFRLPSVLTVELPAPPDFEAVQGDGDGMHMWDADRPSSSDVSAPEFADPALGESGITEPPVGAETGGRGENSGVGRVSPAAVIFGVWALGAVIFFSVSFGLYICAAKRYDRDKRLADKRAAKLFYEICRRNGVTQAPRLYVSDQVGSPILYGFTQPTVLLPELPLSEAALVGVLSHEMTHHIRGDIWIKLACLAAESVYWFNPLVHLAAARCNAEMELSCDAQVLSGMTDQVRRAYGNVMLDIARHCSRKRSALTTGFNSDKNAIKERIMNILDATKKKSGKAAVAAALVLCVIACAVTGCSMAAEMARNGDSGAGGTETETVDQEIYGEGYEYKVPLDNGTVKTITLYGCDPEYYAELHTAKLDGSGTPNKVVIHPQDRGTGILLEKVYVLDGQSGELIPVTPVSDVIKYNLETSERSENGWTLYINGKGHLIDIKQFSEYDEQQIYSSPNLSEYLDFSVENGELICRVGILCAGHLTGYADEVILIRYGYANGEMIPFDISLEKRD